MRGGGGVQVEKGLRNIFHVSTTMSLASENVLFASRNASLAIRKSFVSSYIHIVNFVLTHLHSLFPMHRLAHCINARLSTIQNYTFIGELSI